MFDLVVASIATAIAGFTLTLLPLRQPSPAQQPFTVLLLCLLFFAVGPVVFQLLPVLIQGYIALIPAVFFLLLPSLWCYHQALVSAQPWRWHKTLLKHFLPLPLTLLLAVLILTLPAHEFEQMFFAEASVTSDWTIFVSLVYFAAILSWCLLSLGYVSAMVKCTLVYRQQLKQVYADESGKTLGWLTGVAVLVIAAWLYALLVLLFDDKFSAYGLSESGTLVLLALLVWLVCANGLRQRPGFEAAQASLPKSSPLLDAKPYERSALRENDLHRIAQKLSTAISNDAIYREPDVNLAKLAQHIGEPPQYVTQTLSQHLESTFFDFINKARIDDAKQMLKGSQDSVLDIALATGFNARSSFYKAFKQFTGMTPSEYRKSDGSD